jgi:hypothetical protein
LVGFSLIRKTLFSALIVIVILADASVGGVLALEWTDNAEFNDNGSGWGVRTWQWSPFGSLPISPSEGSGTSDFAEFVLSNGDWVAHLQANYDDVRYIVCAGVTQGWVWSDFPPTGVHQPQPLPMSLNISRLSLSTDVYDVDYNNTSLEHGVLSDVWFRVHDVIANSSGGVYSYYPEAVLGIDLYCSIGGLVKPSDGSFFVDLPSSFSYIKYNLGGAGERVSDVRSALLEASRLGPARGRVFFDPWSSVLYGVEDVVEESVGYSTAKFRHLRVEYDQTVASSNDMPHLYVRGNGSWTPEGPLVLADAEHVDVHVIDGSLGLVNGTYFMRLNGSGKTAVVDGLMLLAVNATGQGLEVPMVEANNGWRSVSNMLTMNDDAYVPLGAGESLLLRFRPTEDQMNQQKYVLVLKGSAQEQSSAPFLGEFPFYQWWLSSRGGSN